MKGLSTADFEAVIPAEQAEPLLLLHRAIARWRIALSQAKRLRRLAEAKTDVRLTRCVDQYQVEIRAQASLVAGAVQAWTGQPSGQLFIRDCKPWVGVLRVEWGEVVSLRDILVGDQSMVGVIGYVLEVVALEKEMMLDAVDSLVEEPNRRAAVREAIIEGMSNTRDDPLAFGHSIASLASCYALMAQIRRDLRGEALVSGGGGST